MMLSGSPIVTHPASPAISEISVGSPSPPPPPPLRVSQLTNKQNELNSLTSFRPLNMKRARLMDGYVDERNVSELQTPIAVNDGMRQPFPRQSPLRRKSCSGVATERVKSFSIADILGKRDASPVAAAVKSPVSPGSPPTQPAPQPAAAAVAVPPPSPQTTPLLTTIVGVSNVPALPRIPPVLPPPPQVTAPATLLPLPIAVPGTVQLQCSDSLRAATAAAIAPPLVIPSAELFLDARALPKSVAAHDAWQAMRGAAVAGMPLRPFLPSALLHYEQRLAWDYQRQLQEHFQTQAQLLRQMSLDPTIIPSEDGSERSHSSSASSGAECCVSPGGVSDAPTTDAAVSSNLRTQRDVDRKISNVHACDNEGKGSGELADGDISRIPNDTPLGALFELSTKNFDDGTDPATLDIFSTRPNPKKKRKSRTAFTNHQIFELEKRFLYQKYLSPVDRDEIAAALGLSNAQVITWFQNRRAKLKRDMEELKKDVESVKQLADQSADINSQQYQAAAYRQRLQEQHLMAMLSNHNHNQQSIRLTHHHHHMLSTTISPLSCQQSQSPAQQHQHQQQYPHKYKNNIHMHNSTNFSQAKSKPTRQMNPTTTGEQQRVSSMALTPQSQSQQPTHSTTAQSALQAQRSQGGITKSTAAEDKKELKMLKMMTLMYYSSRAQADADALPPPTTTKTTAATRVTKQITTGDGSTMYDRSVAGNGNDGKSISNTKNNRNDDYYDDNYDYDDDDSIRVHGD